LEEHQIDPHVIYYLKNNEIFINTPKRNRYADDTTHVLKYVFS